MRPEQRPEPGFARGSPAGAPALDPSSSVPVSTGVVDQQQTEDQEQIQKRKSEHPSGSAVTFVATDLDRRAGEGRAQQQSAGGIEPARNSEQPRGGCCRPKY